MSTIKPLLVQLSGEKVSKCPSFSFNCNNGNYVSVTGSDLSWMKGESLYCVEEAEVAMGELSLI